MTRPFQVRDHASRTLLRIASTMLISDAVAAVKSQSSDYVVISGSDGDVALCEPRTLLDLDLAAEQSGNKSVSDHLSSFPSLFTLEAAEETLSSQSLSELNSALIQKSIPAIAILQDKAIVAAIPQRAILEAVPVDKLLTPLVERSVYGEPTIPTRIYVCQKCTPPSRQRPRSGAAPSCLLNPAHGPMTREG